MEGIEMNADEKEILRQLVREELRKIIDAGLMYTLETIGAGPREPEKGAPSEQPRESAKAEPAYKTEMPDMTKLAWVTVQAPNNPKGPWEKTTDAVKPEFMEMMKILKSTNKQLFSGGYLYWWGTFLDELLKPLEGINPNLPLNLFSATEGILDEAKKEINALIRETKNYRCERVLMVDPFELEKLLKKLFGDQK
jgi:hypothetical protein